MPREHNPCPCTDKRFKLHRSEVQEIRRLRQHFAATWTTRLVAQAFGIHPSHVSNITTYTRRGDV